MTEFKLLSLRTKLLLVGYLGSGMAGLLMLVWVAVVLLVLSVSGEKAVQSLPTRFLFPLFPITTLVMLLSKFGFRWSIHNDRQSGRS